MVATRFRIHGDDDPVKTTELGHTSPFPGGARRLPVVKRILRTWYGRRRDPSPAWARQTAEHSHWLITTSIKANACTVNTNVRVTLCGVLRLASAKHVLLSVAALLVLAMVLGRLGELAAKRGERLATQIPRVQRRPSPTPTKEEPGPASRRKRNRARPINPPTTTRRQANRAARMQPLTHRQADRAARAAKTRQPAAAIPNGATWSRGRSPT